jgi:predicted dehydrogenase
MAENKLRVGIIGAGEVAQVIHLPALAMLSHLYDTTAVCDISKKVTTWQNIHKFKSDHWLSQNVDHCAAKFKIPLATTNPKDIFTSNDVDVVFNLTSDEFHEPYTISALEAGKHVMIEKPITLSLPSAQRIIDAERKAPNGARVFVGYMRRYAKSFTQTFKREVNSIDRILYARARDFSGPNSKFVNESGTFQVKNTDFPAGAGEERQKRLQALFEEAFPGQPITHERVQFCRFLGSLGSHDISLMREVLGSPESVAGVSANEPFYSAIFNYKNQKGGEPFSVTYESGIDGVPDFDAHFAVYGEKKRVTIKYDSPYVKGLPIKVTVQEMNDAGEMETREMLGSYEDAYTAELQELYECLRNGREIKTTAEDAMQELKLYDLMYERWNKDRA